MFYNLELGVFSIFIGLLVSVFPIYLCLKALKEEKTFFRVGLTVLLSTALIVVWSFFIPVGTKAGWLLYLGTLVLVYKKLLTKSWANSFVLFALSTMCVVFFFMFLISQGLGFPTGVYESFI